MRTAVFPGSFDPFTLGHENVVRRSLHLFDKVYVAIGVNSTKKYLFDLSKREVWIKATFADTKQVEVISFEGLTVDLCKRLDAGFILRGLRNPADFQYESNIAHMNARMNDQIETVFLLCDPMYAAINSSIVREIYKNDGDVSQFVPKQIDLHA